MVFRRRLGALVDSVIASELVQNICIGEFSTELEVGKLTVARFFENGSFELNDIHTLDLTRCPKLFTHFPFTAFTPLYVHEFLVQQLHHRIKTHRRSTL
jgi:hypothetical protein